MDTVPSSSGPAIRPQSRLLWPIVCVIAPPIAIVVLLVLRTIVTFIGGIYAANVFVTMLLTIIKFILDFLALLATLGTLIAAPVGIILLIIRLTSRQVPHA